MSNQTEAAIVAMNTTTAKASVGAWFAGLVYALWFSSTGLPPGVSGIGFIYGVILVVGGMFLSSIVIGGGTILVLGGLSKVMTGRFDGKPAIFSLGLIIVPVLCFLAGGWAVYQVADWDPFGLVRHSNPPLEVQCSRPQVTFTLGYNDKLDAGQREALCSCLASTMSVEDQNAMTNATRTGNAKDGQRLANTFGQALRQCGVKF